VPAESLAFALGLAGAIARGKGIGGHRATVHETEAPSPDSEEGVLAGWVSALRNPRLLARDLLAGVTVGLISIPQAVAFALIAGVPPSLALSAMVVPGLAACLIRRSPHLAPGATNTMALLAGAAVMSTRYSPTQDLLPMLSALCVMVGAASLAVGMARLGRLGRYVSPAVVLGFSCGAAALLVLGQLPAALGIRGGSLSLAAFRGVDPLALALSIGTVFVIAGLQRLSPALPAPLLAIAACAGLVHAFGPTAGSEIQLLGRIESVLPQPRIPTWSPEMLLALAPAALSMALVSMTEVISIGRSVALRTGVRFDADREIAAQGAANLVSSCFGCLPSSVSWTRSAASVEAGAQTPAAVAFASLAVLGATGFLAPLAGYVPIASVAGVVIWIAIRMVRLEDLRRLFRADRADFTVGVATAVLTVVVDLPIAVFTGVALSLGLVIRRASLLRLSELRFGSSGEYQELPLGPETGRESVTVLQAEGDLFFAVADELQQRLEQVAENGARGIVVRLKRTHSIDPAAASALATFALRQSARGGRLVLCGLRPELRAVIERTELEEAVGPDAFFDTGGAPFESVERAIQHVRCALQTAPKGGTPQSSQSLPRSALENEKQR
jgi:sulfate permease, SulP family